MDKHLHDTRPTWTREHKGYGAGMALVKVAVCALLVAVVVSSSVPLGRNNAQLPAIAHAATIARSAPVGGTTNNVNGVACLSTSICYAVGDGGTLLATTDGGQTWTGESQGSGTSHSLNGIVCPSTSMCYAVGGGGTLLVSKDGGQTWTDESQSSGTTKNLNDVA